MSQAARVDRTVLAQPARIGAHLRDRCGCGERYGIVGKVFNLINKLRGESYKNVGLALKAA
jgi:hypothetical protein